MSATPIGLTNLQIAEILKLVEADMTEYLGYPVEVRDVGKKGDDLRPRLYNVRDADFNDATHEYFNNICYRRFCEVAKIHGE